MGKLKTDARRTNRTTSSGLLVEALAHNNEVTTVGARVNTKASAVARFQNNPSKMANHPPHKPELNRVCVVHFASHREMATLFCRTTPLATPFVFANFVCFRFRVHDVQWNMPGFVVGVVLRSSFCFRENPSLDLRLCTKIDINGPIWFWEVGVSDLVQKRVANSFRFFAIWRFQEMVPVFTNGIIFVG